MRDDVLGVDHAIADVVVRWRDAESSGIVVVRGQHSTSPVSTAAVLLLKDCFEPRHSWREKKKHRAAHDEVEGNRRGGLGGGLKGNQQRRGKGSTHEPKET